MYSNRNVYTNRDVTVYFEIEKVGYEDATEHETRSAQDTDKTDKKRRKYTHTIQSHRNGQTDKECA